MYEYLETDRVSSVAIFYFEQFVESTSEYLKLLEKKFDPKVYKLDYSKPIDIADGIVDFLKSSEDSTPKKNIVVDISTFTRESLLIILRYLLVHKNNFSEVILFYRCASVAPVLSDGVESIRSVLGYIGDISLDKPTHLVLLSGFEHERAKEIIDSLEPDFISVGYGAEGQSITQELYELNKKFTATLVAYYSGENIRVFKHSLKDPISVKNDLLQLVDEKPEYNTVIAPLNNKISTIGAGLAGAANADIQIIYSQVEEYNESNYSQCVDDCFIFSLNGI